jgi:thiosulfate reductase cytochrome b subunit
LSQLTAAAVRQELADHVRLRVPPATGAPDYGLLQRVTYTLTVFVLLPLMAITGFTMSPAITAAFPVLLTIFGGFQSARTIHFAAFVTVVLFIAVHLVMVVKSGFKRQVRAMTIGGTR